MTYLNRSRHYKNEKYSENLFPMVNSPVNKSIKTARE